MCYNTLMKILAPAGNMDCLKVAVYNGAHEVYLGINDFNARNNVDGFDLNSIADAVLFAHAYGVKVALAVNILFTDDEIQSALDLVVDCYNLGVDYFIMQDLGLIKLVRENYPEIVIHASTQMGLHNLEGVKFACDLGVKRIVLARETPLDEISFINNNTDVELEYFVQGALCVSFSGNCYLSSYLFDASGNRGRCKQLCRLNYTLKKDGKKIKSGYLLSAKDFNMIDRLSDLENAGVDVLKIEGRARRPYYVGTTTREYAKALIGQKFERQNLQLAFNRTYTEGYFNGNDNIISDIQNHIGVRVGKVVSVKGGKRFNQVFITSTMSISPKSTLKFFENNKERTTLSAFDIKKCDCGYVFTTTHEVKVGYFVHLLSDAKLEQDMMESVVKKEIEVDIFVEINKPIKAIVYFEGQQIEVVGEVLSKAKNQPLSKLEIKENFDKNEYFSARVNFKVFESVFMQKKSLNEFRRQVYSTTLSWIKNKYLHALEKVKITPKASYKIFENFQIIEHGGEKLIQNNIIYSPERYDKNDVLKLKKYCEQQGKKLYLDTPNFALREDIKILKEIINYAKVGVVANNYYALNLGDDVIIGAGLNVYNSHTASTFNLPIMFAENNDRRIDFAYMTLRHCPLKCNGVCDCACCAYCAGYEFVCENGKVMKLKRKKLSSCTFYLTD